MTKIIFFGTSSFAVTILESLVKTADFNTVAVVTETDKPAGRKMVVKKPPVKIAAEKENLKIIQPQNLKDENFKNEIKKINPDICVVASYGKFIPPQILKLPKFGFINVHPSLLPKYRGASPIQTAILNGETKTGVTIIAMDEKIDHGPILAQEILEIQKNETALELSERLSKLGAKLLIPTLKKYIEKKIIPQPQDDKKAIHTKQLSRADGKIDWEKPAEEIERMVRAFTPWPGTWTEIKIKNQKSRIKNISRIKITKAKILHPKIGCATDPTPGHLFKTEEGKLAINCRPGSLIIEKLIPEGKKEMSGEEFLRGYRDRIV